MTGPKGNSKFCFPETLNVSRGEAEGYIKVEGKQNSLFAAGTVIECFQSVLLHLPTQKWKKNCENCLLYAGWLIILPRFQVARPDHVRVEIQPRSRVSHLTAPWSETGR